MQLDDIFVNSWIGHSQDRNGCGSVIVHIVRRVLEIMLWPTIARSYWSKTILGCLTSAVCRSISCCIKGKLIGLNCVVTLNLYQAQDIDLSWWSSAILTCFVTGYTNSAA